MYLPSEVFGAVSVGGYVVSDDQHFAVVAGERLAQRPHSQVRVVLFVPSNFVEEGQQVARVGVGHCVGEADLVVLMRQRVGEAEREVVVLGQSRLRLDCFGRRPILVAEKRVALVADVGACPVPPFARLSVLNLREYSRLHPIIVERVGLHEIENVEADFGSDRE